MQRRALLGGLAGILAAGFAPAAIGSGVLMPVRSIRRAPWTTRPAFEFWGISVVESPVNLACRIVEPPILEFPSNRGIHGDWNPVTREMTWRHATVEEMARCVEKFDTWR